MGDRLRERVELGERVSAEVTDEMASHVMRTVALLCLKAGAAKLDEELKKLGIGKIPTKK